VYDYLANCRDFLYESTISCEILQELFVTVRVQESDYFTREGFNVHTEVEISLSQAVLGGIVRIRGLYDDINLEIPSGKYIEQKAHSFNN